VAVEEHQHVSVDRISNAVEFFKLAA